MEKQGLGNGLEKNKILYKNNKMISIINNKCNKNSPIIKTKMKL